METWSKEVAPLLPLAQERVHLVPKKKEKSKYK
jgi:hypothetical protein